VDVHKWGKIKITVPAFKAQLQYKSLNSTLGVVHFFTSGTVYVQTLVGGPRTVWRLKNGPCAIKGC
jgi:hypothetical protein